MTTLLLIFLGFALILQLFLAISFLMQLNRRARIDRWRARLLKGLEIISNE